MAKYIITSIPQYRNGGMKKKKQSVVKSGFNSPVEGGIPQSALSGFMSNESMVNQPTQYTVDPNQQDIPYNQRTSLQQLATQPEFGNVGYGYKKDPFTGELKTVPAGTPTYEEDIFNRLVTNVKANPDAAVDYEGNKLKCAPGSKPWKGVCLTNEEYAQVQAEEEENVNYREEEINQRALKEAAQREERNVAYNTKFQNYINNARVKGNKYKKDTLKPFAEYTKEDWESNPALQQDYDDKNSEVRNAYYIEKKDLGDGNYKMNVYPRQAIIGLMGDYGMKPGEFQTHHGLDAKQLDTELGDYVDYFQQYHVEQGAEMIDKLTKQGYSAEDAKRQLVKTGYNGAKGVSQFNDIANNSDIKNNADIYFVDDNLVMYKKDKTGKVYKYTNSYGNDNFSVNDPSKYKESDNPLKDTKNWIWESVDPSKVKTNKEGNITVNGRSANLYDYGFGDRPGDKNDKAILSKYTTAVGNIYKKSEEEVAVGSQQEMYDNINNTLYDNVYTSKSGQKIEPINLVSTFKSGISTEYVTAYNNLVNQLNKTTDVTKRGKLLDEFNTKTNKSIKVAKPDGKGFYDTKVNMGKFSAYDGQKDWGAPYIPSVNGGRDVKAYKTSSGLKNQINYAKNNEAQNILEYAYTNKINPGSESLNYVGYDGSKYTGEEGDTDLSFAQWSQTPEAQEFITNYNKDPKYAEKIFDVEKNRAEKKWQDYQNENSLWKKPTLSNFLEKTGQQISSLTNQPVYTLNQWASGKEIDPMIGLMPDAPTQSNINDWEAKLGPGGSRLFLDKHTALNKDLSTQIVNLFNPAHYANQTGMNLRNLYEGDPDQGVGDLALNAAFSLLPVSKSLQALSATKLLPGAKYVGKLANNRLYNATRNLITPGAGLTGMFVKDAFLPTGEIDPNTGEEIQGFGIEAGKNIWNEIEKANEKAKISESLPPSSSPFSSLDFLAHLDSDKVKENLFGLGMAGMIGLHGGKQVLGFGKDLYRGVPNRLPANTRLLNNGYNFKMDPAQFNQQFYRSKLDPKEPLRLRKEGGDLPQAKFGRISRSYKPTVFGKPTYKPSSTYFNKGIKTGDIFSSTKKLPTNDVNIKYPIQFGDEAYKLSGEPMYHVDPLDYQGLDWKKEGTIDYLYNETREPTTTFPELEKNLNNVEGSDISIDLNQIGDFRFQDFSDGWEARNFMMNKFDGPQKTLSKSDFWTNKDLTKSLKLNKQFDKHRDEFMDFLSVDDVPGFIKKYPNLAEIFNNDDFKFPRKKFYANEKQKEAIYEADPNYALINPLDKHHLNSLTKGYISSDIFSKLKNDSSLPSINLVNKYDSEWLSKVDPYKYFENVEDLPEAAEILKGIGNINYLPKAEVQALQQKLIQARLNTFIEAAKKDMFSTKKLTGKDAWNKITSQPGWKNKNGGISMQLDKKEINKYVQGGYIVEEE